MNILTAFCFLTTVAATFAGELLHPLSEEFIAEINSKHSTWKAGRNFEIDEYLLFEKLASGSKGIQNREKLRVRVHDKNVDIPESFDSREAWPECADIIGLIRDQANCGSCWAFAAAETMSDRICIHSNGTKKLLVSSQDILCCTDDAGCNGGFSDWPWDIWFYTGYVTGGLYNHTEQGCKAYSLPPCDNLTNKCTKTAPTPPCLRQCDNSSLNYTQEKTFGHLAFGFANEKQIQLEILENGPVHAGFTVYADLASYKSGIYQHLTDQRKGGHAVKIIGWGVENGVKYWTIANSWTERWGENGFFRMIRGINECGIEEDTMAALPDFSRF